MRRIIKLISVPNKNPFSLKRFVNVYFTDEMGQQGADVVEVIPGPSEKCFSPHIIWEGNIVPVAGILRRH